MTAEKILVISKPDQTIHQVPLVNKATLMAYNNRLPDGLKWTFKEMDQAEASKLPFIDKDYVPAGEAVVKLKEMESLASQKDQKILELEKKLAALNAGNIKSQENAVDVIARISLAASADEVTAILGTDDRKTVQDAAAKKIASF